MARFFLAVITVFLTTEVMKVRLEISILIYIIQVTFLVKPTFKRPILNSHNEKQI